MDDKDRKAILEAIKKAEKREKYRQSRHYIEDLKNSIRTKPKAKEEN